ncbi:hypothetical protein P8452_21799 [Trifolium repens]|nr:hypothetical protein P8452_21799 [Trifolium repens]
MHVAARERLVLTCQAQALASMPFRSRRRQLLLASSPPAAPPPVRRSVLNPSSASLLNPNSILLRSLSHCDSSSVSFIFVPLRGFFIYLSKNNADPRLHLHSWLQVLSNIKSLTVSAATLQVFSMYPDLVKVKHGYLVLSYKTENSILPPENSSSVHSLPRLLRQHHHHHHHQKPPSSQFTSWGFVFTQKSFIFLLRSSSISCYFRRGFHFFNKRICFLYGVCVPVDEW